MVDLPTAKQSVSITTDDLKSRAIKSSMGVLPFRRSESIPELNLVHLRGKSVNVDNSYDDNLETARVGTNTPITPRKTLPAPLTDINILNVADRRQPLPAILPMVGTAHTAILQERQRMAKPVVNVPPVKRRKVDVVQIEREALERGTPRSVVNRMINEARILSQQGHERITPHSRLSSKQQSYGTTSSMSSNQQQIGSATPHDDPSRTVVENLIESIKSKKLQEAQRESDRKILEIIHRVLGRTIDLEYDDDENVKNQNEIEQQKHIDDEGKIPVIIEEDDMIVTPRAPDVSRVDLIKDEKLPDDDEDIDGADKIMDDIEHADVDEKIDMSRDPLYRRLLSQITHEELLSVQGTHIHVVTPVFQKNQSLPTKIVKHEDKSVHRFCVQPLSENQMMSKDIRSITQLYHERARYKHQLPYTSDYYQHGELPEFSKRKMTDDENEEVEDQPVISNSIPNGRPSIPYDGLMSLDTDLNIWQNRAAQSVQPVVDGSSAISSNPYLERLWSPAPPKMYIHPRRIKEHLFPNYMSTHAHKDSMDDDNDDEPFTTVLGEHDTIITNFSERETLSEPNFVVPVIKPYKSLERLPSMINNSDEFQMLPTMIRTSHSCSDLTNEKAIRFDTNYAFTLDETKHQIEARKNVTTELATTKQSTTDETQLQSTYSLDTKDIKETSVATFDDTTAKSSSEFKHFRKRDRSVLYSQALAAGRPHISSGELRAVRRSRKDELFWKRIDDIIAIATAPPRSPPTSRRHSFHEAFFYERIRPHVVQQRFRQRRISLHRDRENFDNIKIKYNFENTRTRLNGRRLLNEYEWTRELWYIWLDDYIAELDKSEMKRQEIDVKTQQVTTASSSEPSEITIDMDDSQIKDDQNKKAPDVPLQPITNLQLADSDERQLIENEIKRLTVLIDRDPRDLFSLSRRGALLRKLGLFHDALNDLSLAIYIEPSFMDAFWQRALIFMIFEHHDEALESLNTCIKLNKTHAGAYKLRGDVYVIKNDLALAIANYSQAIRYNPTDHEAYFSRAQTYERRNEILLAMDDYVQVVKLNPKNIEAWYKHGMYYFNTKNYDYAIGDFTELLKRQADHVSARLHRGLAYFHTEYYQEALVDFSATLHYDPSNWQAYYHRACLLRKCNPSKALKDYSISLLINSEYENIGSYLHRALIYCEQEQYDEAIADYEMILVLDREHAPALCNLAIIYMKRNVQKSLQLFTRSIEADPTYVRAYFCRAYFYSQINQLQNSYSDYTKIYHMFPDQNAAMVLRGNMLLAMGKLDSAAFCVEAAAKLQTLSDNENNNNNNNNSSSVSSSIKMSASSPQQQAIVHSFLEQHDYALSIMERECSYHPTPANYRMLGTLRVKAKRFEDARDAFEKCIQACTNNPTNLANELHGAYLDLSKCFIQLKRYPQAIEQLSILIKLQQPNQNAEAYLQRGIAKMRMYAKSNIRELMNLPSNRRPLLDVNKSLSIEPKSAEAYLARAAWYGRCERFTKGILNCNEAIRLKPNLVRAYLYRGCLKYAIRLYDHAITDLTKALEIDQSCSHAYYNRALCYIRRENISNALKDFAIVLCLASTVTHSNAQLLELETYVNRGLLHYEHKDFENALVDLENALHLVLKSKNEVKINTLRHHLIYTIGLCHHRLAQFNKAIKQFTSMDLYDKLANDVNYRHDVWIAEGNVYMDMGTSKSKLKATKLFERILHENPLHERARLNLGYCLRQRGYYQRAWIQFSALLSLNPSHVRALEARAIVCLQMNYPREAFIDLNQALNFEPSSAQLLTNRGVIQQYLGDNKNAMSDYRAAMLVDPQNAFAHYNAGNILMLHGQFLQAIELFNRVLEINPRDEAAYTNRAIAKVVLKQYSSAHDDLKQALSLSPLSAHIHVDLGQLLLTMNKPDEAEKCFTRALEIRPCDPTVYKWRGDARSKQEGRQNDARDDYRTCVELSDALQLAQKHGLIKAPVKTRRRL